MTLPDEVLDAMAKAVHDTEDMAETVWPAHDDDDGYRGDGGWLRLCRDPDRERYVAAAKNALAAAETRGWRLVPIQPTADMIRQPPWPPIQIATIYAKAVGAAPRVAP